MRKFTQINEEVIPNTPEVEKVLKFKDDIVNAIKGVIESNPEYKEYLSEGTENDGEFTPFQNSPVFDDHIVSITFRDKVWKPTY